jgi:mannose-1-phosphate guanylyltransferase/mannose-6-phosphate isomerase
VSPSPYDLRALILAGGSGTRLWPRSTDERPKPFLALTGGRSLLKETFDRAARLAGGHNVFVSGRRSHADLIRHELPGLSGSRMILEPVRRNTAPAIVLSALVASEDGDIVMAVLPSDQAVRDEAAFDAALRTAAEAARTHDAFVTLGIPPTRPETGFGYMEVEKRMGASGTGAPGAPGAPGIAFEGEEGVARVVRFVEKPTLARAQEFLSSGRFLWNAGIFVFRTSLLFEELSRTAPEILDVARRAHAARREGDTSKDSSDSSAGSLSFKAIFSSSPSVSIDVAVMEKARSVLTVPSACGWSDLGSWDAVFDFRGGTAATNVTEGPVVCSGGTGNLVLGGDRPVRVLGLSGLVVVDSSEGLLVMRRGASDELRKSVEEGLARR